MEKDNLRLDRLAAEPIETYRTVMDDINRSVDNISKSLENIERTIDRLPSKSFYLKITAVAVLVETTITVTIIAFGW